MCSWCMCSWCCGQVQCDVFGDVVGINMGVLVCGDMLGINLVVSVGKGATGNAGGGRVIAEVVSMDVFDGERKGTSSRRRRITW